MRAVLIDDAPALRESSFLRMARGDVSAFGEMAGEFLAETKAESAAWESSWAAGERAAVALEIHRCKGGASLFGFERLHALLAECERKLISGTFEFDPAAMMGVLEMSERALADLVEPE